MNVVRRWLYGLFLGSWSLHGHATEPAKVPPKPRQSPARFAHWEYAGAEAASRLSLLAEPRPLGHPHPRAWGAFDQSTLFAARFNMDAARLISGVDVDLNLAGFANLHVMLNSDPAIGDSGRRWALTTDDAALHRTAKSCSITATLDSIRTAPYGDRKLVFFPEVHFALDTMLGAPAGMAAAVRYSQWSPAQTDKGALEAKVPQLFVSWSF